MLMSITQDLVSADQRSDRKKIARSTPVCMSGRADVGRVSVTVR